MKRACFLLTVSCLLIAYSHGSPAISQELDLATSIAGVLEQRSQGEVNILVERALTEVPSVARRVVTLKRALDRAYRDNSVCVASGRGAVGKTAFVCNDNSFAVLFLAREPNQSISSNLRYIEEFATDPLRTSLQTIIHALDTNPVDAGAEPCVRLVLRDAQSGQLDPVAPVVVLVRPSDIADATLASCLE